MTENMLDVVVDRNQWYRGHGHYSSRLRINDATLQAEMDLHTSDIGKMCCLGFACLAAGLNAKEIGNVGYPHSLPRQVGIQLPASLERVAKLEDDEYGDQKIGSVNDNISFTDEEREKAIIVLGLKYGINFTFVGGE
jgi:hypothetical protein